MRLRPLTEAECYARCYGGHSTERVSVVRVAARASRSGTHAGESLRARFERELDLRTGEAEAA